MAEIAGLLYAAETMLLSFSRNPNVTRMNELRERANKLGFWITNPYELCGINDLDGIISGKYSDDAIRVIAERSKIVAANTVPYAELVKLDAARQRAGRWVPFDDTPKTEFVNLIASMLELQKSVAGDAHGSIEDENGHLKRKAVGYVYGYVDAALRSIGQDMTDMSVGVPVTFQVIRKLWPNRAMECTDFLAKNLRSDALVATGIMHGGQQYVDYSKPDAAGAPMGLARFLIEDDEKREKSEQPRQQPN